jgi:ribosomal protein S18 acetylase RimI-like enzyme
MPFGIRHFFRKAATYCALLFIYGIFLALMAYIGTGLWAMAMVTAVLIVADILVYLLFAPVMLMLRGARVINGKDLPGLSGPVEKFCKNAGVPVPAIAVGRGQFPDVFIAGPSRGRAILFTTPGLVEEFNDAEIEAIVTFEIGSLVEMGSLSYNALTAAFSRVKPLLLRVKIALSFRGLEDDAVAIARPRDVPFVVKLLIANGMYNYFGLHDLDRFTSEGYPLFLVAYSGGKPAGFIIGEVNYDGFRRVGHICKIIVDQSQRKKGIGNRLMMSFLNVAGDIGCRECIIEVSADNREAIALYERIGFKTGSVLTGYYPDGGDCLSMAKSL